MANLSPITIVIAFVGGLLSFLSPCVLPLVPGYISLISGVSIEGLKGTEGSRAAARRAVMINSLAFNAGLSIIFVALGAGAGLIGSAITSNPWIRIIGGVVIIAFGLQLIGILKIGALYRDTRQFSDEKPRGAFGSLILGIAFAAGWTPCIGPILGGIIGLAATSGGWQSGFILSSFYAAGLAVPFLITGLAINQFLGFYARFRQHLHKVEVISGVILILIGALVASGYSTMLASSRLAAWLPNLESRLEMAPSGTTTPPTAANNAPTESAYPSAPDAEFRTIAGEPFRLSSMRGRVVVLNFWATWCVPCRAEIPEFNAMQREWEARGISFVGVSTHDAAEAIRGYDLRLNYTSLVADESVATMFETGQVRPVTYIIDRAGHIRQKIVGARTRAGFEAAIRPVLDEPQADPSGNQTAQANLTGAPARQ